MHFSLVRVFRSFLCLTNMIDTSYQVATATVMHMAQFFSATRLSKYLGPEACG